jgi:hypothetical protein
MKQTWIALVALISWSAFAYSQPPAPTPSKTGNQNQTQSKDVEQQPAQDLRGTDQSPFFVKVVPSPKTPEETSQEKCDRDQNAANEQAARETNGDIARFNRWLVIVGSVQAAIFVLQLVVFGIQASNLRQTVKLAERAERPYVFLGAINGYVFPDSIGQRLQERGARATPLDQLPCVKFRISNNGHSPAIIQEIGTALVAFNNGVPAAPDYSVCFRRPGELILAAGQVSDWLNHLNDDPTFPSYAANFEEVRRLYSNDTTFVFYGFIRFEDAAGEEYRTGFGLRAMSNTVPNHFYTVGGKNYNYRT